MALAHFNAFQSPDMFPIFCDKLKIEEIRRMWINSNKQPSVSTIVPCPTNHSRYQKWVVKWWSHWIHSSTVVPEVSRGRICPRRNWSFCWQTLRRRRPGEIPWKTDQPTRFQVWMVRNGSEWHFWGSRVAEPAEPRGAVVPKSFLHLQWTQNNTKSICGDAKLLGATATRDAWGRTAEMRGPWAASAWWEPGFRRDFTGLNFQWDLTRATLGIWYDDMINKHGDRGLKCLKHLEIGYGYYGWVLMYC